jgi:hypothetical protein
LLKAISEKTKFNAFDFIIQEMWNIAISNNRSCDYAPYIMALVEAVSKRTFLKDVEHIPLRPKKQYNSLPPSATSVPSAAATSSSDEQRAAAFSSSSSSSGRSAFFKHFKDLFSMCQSNKQSMDVVREHQEVPLENQRNLYQKMQVEQPFNEFSPVEALSELPDPFASLTAIEMVFLGMDAPGTLTSHARCKHASTTVPDFDDEIEEEDDGDDGDYEDEDDE